MERLTKRTVMGIVGNNASIKNYPLYKVAQYDELDRGITGQCFEKLADYEDLDEQGLLLRLPCKVETSVYMVAQDCGGDTLDCRRGDCEGCPYLYSFVEENKFEAYMCDESGKTVFLTQAEAEQKLKEMNTDNGITE